MTAVVAASEKAGEAQASPALAIPKIFHFVWFGDLPEHLEAYVKTWQEHHPQWDCRFWDESNIPQLTNQRLFDRADELAGDRAGQLRGDIVRYELLYKYGGVYVDCDFECQRPLDWLLVDVGVFAAWEDTDVWVNNAILGATPQHQFLQALINGLSDSVLVAHAGKGIAQPNIVSGPQYFTGVYHAFKNDVTVFPKDLFYPYLWNELHRIDEDFPEAYAIHHWNHKRSRS